MNTEAEAADKAITDRLDKLSEKLLRIFRMRFDKSVDFDELMQEANIRIWQTLKKNPDANDSFLIQAGIWSATDWLRKDYAQNNMGKDYRIFHSKENQFVEMLSIEALLAFIEQHNENSYEKSTDNFVSACDLLPQDQSANQIAESHETISELVDAVKSLGETDQVIVTMVYGGERNVDIAKKLGISPARVTLKRQLIAKKVQEYQVQRHSEQPALI